MATLHRKQTCKTYSYKENVRQSIDQCVYTITEDKIIKYSLTGIEKQTPNEKTNIDNVHKPGEKRSTSRKAIFKVPIQKIDERFGDKSM
jgi:hypothetical protein